MVTCILANTQRASFKGLDNITGKMEAFIRDHSVVGSGAGTVCGREARVGTVTNTKGNLRTIKNKDTAYTAGNLDISTKANTTTI